MRVNPHSYGKALLLAVSGGVDSMVMASMMLHYSAQSGSCPAVRLAVAHCNFHLRGGESDSDEALVREWARKNSLECFVAGFDTRSYAVEHHISIEMAARELRYTFFDSLCSGKGFDGVCVAHNADDNAETLLLNLIRGTGLDGICAMGERSRNPYGSSAVFRPMLGFSRAQIKDYALKYSVSWHEDSTNALCDARRNVLRNQVLPVLKRLNPSLIQTLGSDIRHFAQAREIVEASLAPLDGIIRSSGGRTAVRITELKALPFWRYSLFEGLHARGFNASVIQDLTQLLDSDRVIGGRTFEGESLRIVTTSSELLLEDREPVLRSEEADSPGVGETGTGIKEMEIKGVRVELLDWPPEPSDGGTATAEGGVIPRTPRGTILMDADALGGVEPVLRPWRPGDFLCPIGLKGRKKVSDMLTDLKYSISEKKNVLVVEGEGSHVLAVVGERIDRSVAVTGSTRRVYRITIE